MNSSLEELKVILPPPPDPYEAKGDWSDVEYCLQTSLPEDYRALIETYGSGYIHDVGFDSERDIGTSCDPSVLNPFCRSSGANLFRRIGSTIEYVGRNHRSHPEYFPYPPWPHRDGLLCWATTGNGDSFYWLTKGKPNDWKIVAMHDSSAQMYDFESTGAVDFLVQLFGNRIAADRDLFGPFKQPVFEPVQRPSLKGRVNPFTGKPYDA